MPTPIRHFIGKDVAAPEAITRWCRRQWPNALPHNLFFCVPTSLAFRRLRDALTLAYGGFHGVNFIQPSGLLRLFAPRTTQPIATPSEQFCLWDEVFDWLQHADPEQCIARHLFPGKRDWMQRPHARYAVAQRFIRLRATLAEQQLDFNSVAKHPATATLDEYEQARWQALDALETKYHEALQRHKLADPTDCQLEVFRNPVAQPQETGNDWRLIIACVPDIMPALTTLFAKAPACDILIQAEPNEASHFDPSGLPLPAARGTENITLPEECLHVTETPSDEAIAIDRFLRTLGHITPSQLCLGILDHEVIPTLTSLLGNHGVSVFAPEPLSLADRPPTRALRALLTLLPQEHIDALLPLLSIPEVATAVGSDYVTLRSAYNTLVESNRPQSFTEAFAHLAEGNPLRTLILLCRDWRAAVRKDLVEGLRAFLVQLYGKRVVNPTQDALCFATFDALRELLNELSSLRVGENHPPTADLLLSRLAEVALHPVRHGADCSYEGRLELLWSSAPILVLAGLNEGIYPDTTFEDDFLPNTFRRKLGLRSDVNRVARDAYILSIITAQRTPDHLCLLCARTNHRGDWLKPSRLLFHCDTETRFRRARQLFLEPPPRTEVVGTQSALAFAQNPVTWKNFTPPQKLSPSAIKTFLRSPLNYWLERVLRLEDPGEQTDGVDPMSFGVLLHETLETLPQIEATSTEGLAANLIAHLHTLLQQRYGSEPDVEVIAVRYDAEARLKTFASLEMKLRAEGWQTTHIEAQTRTWSVPITVDGHTILLSGQIDRIDRNPTTGAIRVIDYKTGKKGSPPNETHYALRKKDNTCTWLDFQLPIYRQIVRHALALSPETPIELAYITLPIEGDAQLHRYADPIDEPTTWADLRAVLSQLLALGSAPLPADVGTYGDDFLATLVAPTLSTEATTL